MTRIALIGAGGKMGFRLSRNLKGSDFSVDHVEVSEAGRQRLSQELGTECTDAERAVPEADVVILAVPDTLVGKISHQLSPMMKSDTMVITLDAAAPFAGHLPERDDLTYFVTHPCHPPIFNDETDLEAKKDYFGGLKATHAEIVVRAIATQPDGTRLKSGGKGRRIEVELHPCKQ